MAMAAAPRLSSPLCRTCGTAPADTRSSSSSCSASAAPGQQGLGLRRAVPAFRGLRAVAGREAEPTLGARLRSEVRKAVKQTGGSGGGSRRAATTCATGTGTGTGMTIIFVSAECAPWSKTGGLGDVLGGLPPALAARGHRVMTIAPRYDQYKDAWDTSTSVEVQVGGKTETVGFFHTFKRGVDRVFVDHPLFLAKVWGKTGSKIYGPVTGTDYLDNQLRFSLFNQAAIEAARVLNLDSNEYFSGPYGEDVIFVANDWHTALLPCYLKSIYQAQGAFKNAKVAFVVHNIAYQGRFAFADFNNLSLPDEFKSSFDFIDGYDRPVKGRKINWLKAGFLESHLSLTVSPNYAKELTAGADKGVELDNIARKVGVKGIVNGMDTVEWDPSSDKYLDLKYNEKTVLEAKPTLKELLLAELGLSYDPNKPLFGFIGRLEEQKGSDILNEALPEILAEDVQLVVLGTGKKKFEEQLEQLEVLYPDKARGVVKFNVPLAHQITAGADFMLVPSRFEPCGLIQLHAMRYGTVPVVASTGGLVDTVKDGVTGFHIGSFNVDCDAVDPADVKALAAAVKRAAQAYKTPEFSKMIKAGMAQDLSWKGPARIWEDVLLGLQVEGSEKGQEGDEIAPKELANVATP